MEKRFESRRPADVSVSLSMIGGETLRARVRNASDGGVQLEVDRPVEVGRVGKLDVAGVVVFGEIHYCKLSEDAYLVGMEFTPRLRKDELAAVLSMCHPAAR